jgi:hypothetical protein
VTLSDPITAASIGAGAAIVSMFVTQFAFVRAQYVRTRRAALLERRLENAYGPLDYWLSILSDVDAPAEARARSWEGLQEVLLRHGYLLSAQLRADLYRLHSAEIREAEAADVFLAFREEYEDITKAYYRTHFVPRRLLLRR